MCRAAFVACGGRASPQPHAARPSMAMARVAFGQLKSTEKNATAMMIAATAAGAMKRMKNRQVP